MTISNVIVKTAITLNKNSSMPAPPLIHTVKKTNVDKIIPPTIVNK